MVTALLLLTLTAVQTVEADGGPLMLRGGLIDYAPHGVPDFSACNAAWSRPNAIPGQPGQWTHAGPAAAANALWWLDSVAEPSPRPPSQPNDGHPLVTAYRVFGPPLDDHEPANVVPLIEDIAWRVNTDGRGRPGSHRGTKWHELVTAVDQWIAMRGVADHYRVEESRAPDASWLASQVQNEAGVIIGLGLWERQGDDWVRIGGHYATLAGADELQGQLVISDPVLDSAVAGVRGRIQPGDAALHSCRDAPRTHDDAAIISHDAYDLFPPPDLPRGALALAGYFTLQTSHNAAAFAGLNPAEHLSEYSGSWRGGVAIVAIDAAVAVVPRSPNAPEPTVVPSPTPPASATTTETSTPEATPAATVTQSAEPPATTPPTGVAATGTTTSAPPTPTDHGPQVTATATAAASATSEWPDLPVLPTVAISPSATPLFNLPKVRPIGRLWLPVLEAGRRRAAPSGAN